ncbi:RSN1 [Symbiodinium microadriaticum]|nr:RSN1 [Symbiodinium microadriaticum]
MLVLWPVYFTASVHQDGVAGVNLYTMANINKNGDRLYASAICCWLFATLFILMIEEEYKEFVSRRQAFILKDDPDVSAQKRYSVIVQNIPVHFRSSKKLHELFDHIFPGKVHSAQIAYALIELEKCIERRTEILMQLELAIAHFKASDMKDRKLVGVNKEHKEALCCGTKVDAIEFYQGQLDLVNNEIQTLRSASLRAVPADPIGEADDRPSGNGVSLLEKGTPRCDGETEVAQSVGAAQDQPTGSPAGTGFVTFNSRTACLSAYRVGMLSDVYPNLKVQPAGPSTEIIWENLSYSSKQAAGGKSVTKTVFTAGMVFWGSVLVFIGAISNLESLEKYLPFIEDLDSTTYSLLAGLLPVAVMGYFLSLLPVIFAYGAKNVEKATSMSAVQVEVFHWLFSYQLTNVVVTILSGSLFTSLVDALDNPSSIVTLLGASLPGISVFFGNFTLSAAVIGSAAELLQIIPFAVFTAYRILFNERTLTKRQLVTGPLEDRSMDYGAYLPAVLFIFYIVLIYWVMSPLVVLFGSIYFLAKGVVLKYLFLYVFVPKFEMGGKFYFNLFSYSFRGLFLSSIIMIVYMGIKQGSVQAALIFPIPIIIHVYWKHLNHKYEHLAQDLAYWRAVESDECTKTSEIISTFSADYYSQPSLLAPPRLAPQPYRLGSGPIITTDGSMSEEYAGAIVEVEVADDLT